MSERHRKVLEWIHAYIQDHGRSPTLREISQGMGWSSMGSAVRVVREMRAAGILYPSTGSNRCVVPFEPPPCSREHGGQNS